MSKIGDRLRQRYKDREGNMPATQRDIARIRGELDKGFKRSDPARVSGRQAVGRTVRMMRRGFADIGKSLNTPSAEGQRPRISQLPGRRRDIGISRRMDLGRLKMPGMSNMNLTWAPGQNKKKRRR